MEIYDHVVAPIINNVLEGYNCTVFYLGKLGPAKPIPGRGR
jgi:kinesin family protein 11